ncbi:Methionine--tRNA ligase [bioreactor metagenome]|uniref:Methionine--tRNA ligase n=1 Tax=bioreactor metagenome TaxID=1076179 RepID=A0A645CR25_9ZZZZ
MIDGQKMSKSLGNVISPQQLIDLFGVDGARYLIARSFPSENDSDVGIERFKEKYNADLANNLGNLVSRITKLAEGLKIDEIKNNLDQKFVELIDNCRYDEAIGLVFEKFVNTSNAKLNEVTPWKLEKDDPKRIEVLNYCVNNLKQAANHLNSIMPETAQNILNCFDGEVRPLEKPLFPRI